MAAPAATAAQERSPTPSSEDLWRAYPLHEEQEPTSTPDQSRPASAPAGGDGDGTPVVWPAAVLAALLGVAGFVVLRRRSGGRRSISPALAGPLLPAALATAMVQPRNHRPRRLTDLAMDASGRGD